MRWHGWRDVPVTSTRTARRLSLPIYRDHLSGSDVAARRGASTLYRTITACRRIGRLFAATGRQEFEDDRSVVRAMRRDDLGASGRSHQASGRRLYGVRCGSLSVTAGGATRRAVALADAGKHSVHWLCSGKRCHVARIAGASTQNVDPCTAWTSSRLEATGPFANGRPLKSVGAAWWPGHFSAAQSARAE